MTEAAQHEHPTDQQAQNTQYYLRVLHNLTNMANDIACLLHRQITAPAQATQPAADPHPDQSPPDHSEPRNIASGQSISAPTIAPSPAVPHHLVIPFETIARTIRRTVLLSRTINAPVPPRAAPEPWHRSAAQKPTIRDLEHVIRRRARAFDEAERLDAELLDRLDDPDLHINPATLPDDILGELCRVLRLAERSVTHPPNPLTAADIESPAADPATKIPREARASSAPAASGLERVVAIPPSPQTVPGNRTDPPSPTW